MSDDNLNDALIDRLRQYAPKPNDNVEAMRTVAAKLHARASSQDKNIRTRTLERLWHKNTGILQLLITLLESVRDHVTVCSLASLLHDCVSPKAGKLRSPAVKQLIAMNATQSMMKLIKQQQSSGEGGHPSDALMHEIVWIIAQLAQKDPKFAAKARALGAVKTFHSLLRSHHNNVRMIYPTLLVIKSLARQQFTATVLIKDGIVGTLEKTLVVIGFSANPKLRLALNVVNHLTKNKLCCVRMSKTGIVHLLLRIFERWDRFEGKLKHRICSYSLFCLQRISGTKLGRKGIRQSNGLTVLHKFSVNCPEDKCYDNLLSRVCGIINMCLEKKQLPVDNPLSPAVFALPVLRDYSSDELLRGASSSRETSPGSDEEDDEEVDEDDEDGVTQEKEPDEDKAAQFFNIPIYVRDIDELKEYNRNFREFFGLGSSWPSSQSNTELGGVPSCRSFSVKAVPSATEMVTTLSQNLLQQKDAERTDSARSLLTSSEPQPNKWFGRNCLDNVRGLVTLNGIPNHSSNRHAHCMVASRVNSVLPFVKVAYPDLMGGDGAGMLEKLNVKDRKTCRAKLLSCVDRGLHPGLLMDRVVYDLDALNAGQISQPEEDGADRVLFNLDEQYLGQKDVTKTHLLFESRFESGNLRKAIQIAPKEYDLILMPDVNSSKHHQWFYFQVSNMEANVPYIFNIVNCEKQNSQFNYGMKPIMYSVQEAVNGHHGWVRTGTDICYYRNSYMNPSTTGKLRSYLTTTFTVQFQHAHDVCYFAYHYPYTYSQLMTQIWKWASLTDATEVYFRAESLCLSLNNNETPLLTITAPDCETNRIQSRETVFLTSRVHPGESNASWVMHGTLSHLLSDLTSAYKLRQRYVFKVVPMLNMEGVINGCHRCGLTDEDLNRRWSRPNPTLHPVIYHTKGLIDYCTRVLRKPPAVYCDYHGHSRRKNVFLYGCSAAGSWSDLDRAQPENPAEYLMLPHLMKQFSPSFSLSSCNFRVERGRESTARVAVWREFGVKRSYTMESSYCGCDQGLYQGHHLDTLHLKEVGATFCEAVYAMNDDTSWRMNLVLGPDSGENDGTNALFTVPTRKQGDSDIDSDSLENSDSDEEEDCHCLL